MAPYQKQDAAKKPARTAAAPSVGSTASTVPTEKPTDGVTAGPGAAATTPALDSSPAASTGSAAAGQSGPPPPQARDAAPSLPAAATYGGQQASCVQTQPAAKAPPAPPATGSQQATLEVYAFQKSGDADCGREEPVPGVLCEAFVDGQMVARETTDDTGTALLRMIRCGLAHIDIQQEVCMAAGKKLSSLLPPGVQKLVARGQQARMVARFAADTAGISVTATLTAGPHGGDQEPLPGVQVALFAGEAAVGEPVCRVETRGHAPTLVLDLAPGSYTAVARPPAVHDGHAIEAVDVALLSQTFDLAQGDVFPLAFKFRRALARVFGQVLDARTHEGLPGVQLLLSPAEHGGAQHGTTGDLGAFRFDDLRPGHYLLGFASAKTVLVDRKAWVPPDGAPREHQLHLRPGQSVHLPPLLLEPDRHVIAADVVDDDDQPVPYAEVIIQDKNRQQYGVYNADDKGHLEVQVDGEGLYYLIVKLGLDGLPATAVPLEVHSRGYAILHSRGSRGGAAVGSLMRGGGGGGGAAGGGDAVLDIPYPLLTESAMFPGSAPAPAAGGGAPDSGALGQSVAGTLRSVLGWRPRAGDSKGFLSALNQAFTLTDFEGHRDWKWMQPTFAVQPDMGGITGAQASLYTRAKAAIDQSLPLLDGLSPLRPDAAPVDYEAIRSIVRTELTQLVGELGQEGGPRVQRVSSLFDQLLGTGPLPKDPEQVGGQLRRLRAEFGMDRSRVNTIDEEQNLTNFLILVDYVTSLKQSWDAQRQFFDRRSGVEPYLGTQLVLVSRALALLAETVQEIYFVMDSVFLGAADRQVVELRLTGEPLTIAELLSWVETVASEEGPRLIQDGGKTGVIALRGTIGKLSGLVKQALIPPQDATRLPAGYRTARVQRSMQELSEHLAETAALIAGFQQTDPLPI
jgi:hypothetical protein